MPAAIRRNGGPPSRAATFVILGGVFAVALANRLAPVLRGAGLAGVLGYDDAVYYAGTVGFVHGQLPYRDFLYLHPPGVLVALAPVAASGQLVGEATGWQISRVAFMLLGCLTSMVLAAMLLPMGRIAGAVAGCAYAVFPGAVLVERTTLLEGITNFCLAVALALLIREFASSRQPTPPEQFRRLLISLLAGGILGFSASVKIWGVVPLITICVFTAAVLGIRCGVALAAGAVITITVICLPFFLAAPGKMWQMVILDQLGRDGDARLVHRAMEILTLGRISAGVTGTLLVIIAVASLIVCSVAVWKVRRFRIVVPLLGSIVLLLMSSPLFFPHYAAILAVPTAAMAGVITGVLTGPSRRTGWRYLIAAAGCSALLIDLVVVSRIRSGEPGAVPLTTFVDPAQGCLTSDDANNLLALGVVGRNIERGCPLVVDLGGYSHHLSATATVPRTRNLPWQHFVLDYLGSGHYTLPTRFSEGYGYSSKTAAEVESWPLRASFDRFQLREPPP